MSRPRPGHLWRFIETRAAIKSARCASVQPGDGILLDVREHLQVSGTVGMFDDATGLLSAQCGNQTVLCRFAWIPVRHPMRIWR